MCKQHWLRATAKNPDVVTRENVSHLIPQLMRALRSAGIWVSERMSRTSGESYGVPLARKMSWNQILGSTVYSLFHESHG